MDVNFYRNRDGQISFTNRKSTMPILNVKVTNKQSSNYYCHIFDLFAGGRIEVAGSPFALTSGETSPPFQVKDDGSGQGKISYQCDGGPSLGGIDVEDGSDIKF